ncbi:MAG TPA: site-specific integrase [Mycobacterium sp.]|uniref:site-specific integrase n=1 Tax=Mycobacterium sp. TaxID=1785 RepID=UPI002BFE2E8C|nr:site-specific integrase [Mycobacterium sp.]HME74299.1 site-specific integrase [Mycobacterium sp.]
MNARIATVVALPQPEAARWVDWLRDHVDPAWRPGQWNQDLWLFTATSDDPTVVAKVCAVASCDVIVGKDRMCIPCTRAFKASGLPLAEFAATHKPNPTKLAAHFADKPPTCLAKGKTPTERCQRTVETVSLCRYHYRFYLEERQRNPGLTPQQWADTTTYPIRGAQPLDRCVVEGCDRDVRSPNVKLCVLHYFRYRRSKSRVGLERWAKTQSPFMAAHQFSLIHLSDQLRWEMLYAIQRRDARGGRINPGVIRKVVRIVQAVGSLALMGAEEFHREVGRRYDTNLRAHLLEFGQIWRLARYDMVGHQPEDQLVWDLSDIGFIGANQPSRKTIDFGVIIQPWLRDLTMAWAREQTTARALTTTYRVAVTASNTLEQRADRGQDVTKLGQADVDAIADRIGKATKPDGSPCGAKHKRGQYNKFVRLIEYGRRHGHLAALPASLDPDPSRMVSADPAAERISKAIPFVIQRQLDAATDLLGRDIPHGVLSDEQTRMMFHTAYVILRDTGRRPLEVASLKMDCFTGDSNGPILIYDNHKPHRLGRRLPILQSTAETIGNWRIVRAGITGVEQFDGYPFPGTRSWYKHLQPGVLSSALRKWVRSIERLDTNEVDDRGEPVPFDRNCIYPYAFRHSYAQRHADQGVPIDVLRELMDHQSMNQTALYYYTITADRKRSAIQTIGTYAVDRTGAPAPLTQATRYQMRSVAVPFGNCTEPANVKAGGQACRIRFQCAGCGFYRPDPSYIPAIEQQIHNLRADRETAQASGSAAFVVDNLTAQIDAYQHVLATMRENLDRLDTEERRRVEDAASALRKVRAGAGLPLIDISRTRQEPR